jgi:predicted RNA methylase
VDYVALFPAGAASLVAEGLQSLLPGADVSESDDSALSFATQVRLDSADAVPIAKNLFLVRRRVARRDLNGTVADLANRAKDLPRPRDGTGFRVMFHVDGQLVASSPRARQALEEAISAATGLRAQPRGSCQEYWVIGRRDWPAMYLAERLPASRTRLPVDKGSLSGEVSALLVSLSRPDPADVFLDPFAGSGSIVAARLATPARKVIFNDRDRSLYRAAAARLGHRAGLAFSHDDGTAMTSVRSAEVSAIVTDPPWGEHDESIGDYAQFTRSMAAEFSRVLNPRGGRLVLLISRRHAERLEESLAESGFTCEPAIGILVSGHPASVIRSYPSVVLRVPPHQEDRGQRQD